MARASILARPRMPRKLPRDGPPAMRTLQLRDRTPTHAPGRGPVARGGCRAVRARARAQPAKRPLVPAIFPRVKARRTAGSAAASPQRCAAAAAPAESACGVLAASARGNHSTRAQDAASRVGCAACRRLHVPYPRDSPAPAAPARFRQPAAGRTHNHTAAPHPAAPAHPRPRPALPRLRAQPEPVERW
jgi:hypothetical protein